MATKVAAMPTAAARGGRAAMYPWALWLDGSIWKLTKGEDFKHEANDFRPQVYMAARTRGLVVHTSTDGDDLYVQVDSEGA